MPLTKPAKSYIILGTLTALLAIVFAVLYHFNFIKTLDLFLAVTYVLYFVGLSFYFNGGINRERGHAKAKRLNYVIAAILILTALAMLIYGFVTGEITMFK